MKFSDYLNEIDNNDFRHIDESVKLIVISDEYSAFFNNLTKHMSNWQWSNHTDYKDPSALELFGRFMVIPKVLMLNFKLTLASKI